MRFVKFKPSFRPDPKKVSIPKAPKKLVKKVKITGELELFKLIWNEREHWCQHCESFIRDFQPSNFHHILSKKQHPELRLKKNNVIIYCFDCHFSFHNQSKEQFEKRRKINPKFLGKLQ